MSGSEVQIILGLMVAIAAIALLAEKLKLPYPILMVMAGTVIGFLPGLPREQIQLDPHLFFILVLPPLLYHGGFMTSWRDFRANSPTIMWMAIGLVLVTTIAIAYTAHWLIPGMPLVAGFILGAIASPPDAIAATAITQRLAVPKRVVTVLEGESLVNDAAALVTYSIALSTMETGNFSLPGATVKFLILAIGGIIIGLLAGWVIVQLHLRIHEPHVEGIVSLLGPYLAYIPAEMLHVSGVLSAVTAGIYLARHAPLVLTASGRMRLTSVWETLVFLLNGAVFILIGLQLPAIASALSHIHIGTLLKYAVVISLVTIGVRLIWVFGTAGIWSLKKKRRPIPWNQVAIVGWAGMRGIVTLAAAIALPMTFGSEKIPFEQREMIIYLAFSIILVTLVFQGLTLAPIIKWLNLSDDGSDKKEEWEARLDAAHAAVARLQVLSLEEDISEECMAIVKDEYDQRINRLAGFRKGVEPMMVDEKSLAINRLRKEALTAERRMIAMMRDQNIIGDEVLRHVLRDIDLAEARLSDH